MSCGTHFFVVGCPRSGTTLLSVLLDRHSRLCVTPETAFFDEIAPQLPWRNKRRLLSLLRSWRRLRELNIRAEAVMERLEDRTPTAGLVLSTILDLYARNENKARSGEKTPQHLAHVTSLLDHFPDTRILCLLRDGTDVALSLNAMPWWTQELKAAAKLWQRSAALACRFAEWHSRQFKLVRYEDLVSQPQQTLAGVMSFLGETFQPRQLDPATPSRLVLQRSLDWKGTALQAVQVKSIGWRRTLATAQQLKMLHSQLGATLRRNGYQPPP